MHRTASAPSPSDEVSQDWAAAVLSCTAHPRETAAFDEGRLVIFTRALLFYLATRDAIRAVGDANLLRITLAATLVAALGTSLVRRTTLRSCCCVAGCCVGAKLAWLFPNVSNHLFVEALVIAFVSASNLNAAEDRKPLIQALRWLPVLVLFWSGAQKVLYGTYLNGAFLASAIESRGFSSVLSWVLTRDEFHRTRDLVAQRIPGAIQLKSAAGLALSHVIYLGEITAATSLIVPRLRFFGTMIAFALLVGIAFASREFMFGLLMVNLLSLFFPASWYKPIAMLGVAACVLLFIAATGLVDIGPFN